MDRKQSGGSIMLFLWFLFMWGYAFAQIIGGIAYSTVLSGCWLSDIPSHGGWANMCSIFIMFPPIIIGPIMIVIGAIHIFVASILVCSCKCCPLLQGKSSFWILSVSQLLTAVVATYASGFWIMCRNQQTDQGDSCWFNTTLPSPTDDEVNTYRNFLMIGAIILALGDFGGTIINAGLAWSYKGNGEPGTEPINKVQIQQPNYSQGWNQQPMVLNQTPLQQHPFPVPVTPLVKEDEGTRNFEIPLILEKPNLNIHECVKAGVGHKLWGSAPYQRLFQKVSTHLEQSQIVRQTIEQYPGLTRDAIGALVYYTSDLRGCGGTEELNIYRILNGELKSRDQTKLQDWMPFISYAFLAKTFLPKFNGTVYRGLDEPITKMSKQYTSGNKVTWIGFSSTSKSKNVIKDFSKKVENNGTWMIIKIKDGVEIPFSLFPHENEVLLFPNTSVKVVQMLSDEMKDLMGFPRSFDFLEFVQDGEYVNEVSEVSDAPVSLDGALDNPRIFGL